MKNAKEVLAAAGYPEAIINAFSAYDLRKYAKKADPKWVEPPKDSFVVELKTHTPKKGNSADKEGMYLSISTEGAFGGVFHRLNDGDTLDADGKALLIKLLTSVGTAAVAMIDELS